MSRLTYAEFYITNVCNLSCRDCNRFNNFLFSGHQRWDDYKDLYGIWAGRIDLMNIGILGGEPMANPDFMLWITGIADLWPLANITIISNGTYLDRWPDLYNVLSRYQGRIQIEINEHDSSQVPATWNRLQTWLQDPVPVKQHYDDYGWRRRYQQLGGGLPQCQTVQAFAKLPEHCQEICRQHDLIPENFKLPVGDDAVIDQNLVRLRFVPARQFWSPAVKIENDRIRLHRSDPQAAIDVCYFKTCPHFIRGKLYKCGPTGILPEFIDQFAVDIEGWERDLIKNYHPAQVDWSDKDLSRFLDGLVNYEPIPQCRFCPDQHRQIRPGDPNTKKIKIHKKNDLEISPL